MNCDDCSMRLADPQVWTDSAQRSVVVAHLAVCSDCRDALTALDALHAVREVPVRQPGNAAIARVIEAAMTKQLAVPIRTAGFWTGLAAGAAAASIVAVTWLMVAVPESPPGSAAPEVSMALHRPATVSIGIESAEALAGAEIHIALRGAVDLEGFEGQRDIRWAADLVPGINELTLPVVAVGEEGGQVVVEVYHGDKLKTFTVDVRALRGGDAA